MEEVDTLKYVVHPSRKGSLNTPSSSSANFRHSSNFHYRWRPPTSPLRADSESEVNQNIAYVFEHREQLGRNPNQNVRPLPGYHFHSASTVIHEPSYENLGRRRHLMASRGALMIPPVSTALCLTFILTYLYREKLHVRREQDICINRELVWGKRQYWRLFVAQFFHFNKLNVLVNAFCLFTVGRYLERKITPVAMFLVIIAMSAMAHCIYLILNPFMCHPPQTQFLLGFGHIIYSLRVLLAYSLEPRNYERDLVFGLYPMIVSASHAPWQPILDLLIYYVVLHEQCVSGQASGIIAGFLCSWLLLLCPIRGIYIARPPYYWTFMGSHDPNRPHDQARPGTEEENWTLQAYTDSEFWLAPGGLRTPPSPSLSVASITSSATAMQLDANAEPQSVPNQVLMRMNSLERRSVEMKARVSRFFSNPTESIANLMASLRPKEPRQKGKGQKLKTGVGATKVKPKRQVQLINEDEAGLHRVPDQMEIPTVYRETPSRGSNVDGSLRSTEILGKRRSSCSGKTMKVIFAKKLEDSIDSMSMMRCRSRGNEYGLCEN